MSEQSDTSQEKTEEPTPKRLQQARDKGQVARSRELNTVAVLLAGAGGLMVFGPQMLVGLIELIRDALSFDRGVAMHSDQLGQRLGAFLLEGLLATAPLAVLLFLVALIAPMALGGLAASAQAIAPKWEKLDPVKGLKRVFGPQGLMELLKALGKFLVITVAGAVILWSLAGDILDLTRMALLPALQRAAWLCGWAFVALSSVLLVIAAVDVPFQIWQHTKQLRMTRQEVKDELKDTEGKPEVKAKMRQTQREMARGRMMADVPTADVVVTNPTHYAVALRYEREERAPTVVAKGVDHIAEAIRELAREHDVECLEAPPLARALYGSTEIGQEIPASLFVAVAQVLAYVYQLKDVGAGTPAPTPPTDLPVPSELDPKKQEKS